MQTINKTLGDVIKELAVNMPDREAVKYSTPQFRHPPEGNLHGKERG